MGAARQRKLTSSTNCTPKTQRKKNSMDIPKKTEEEKTKKRGRSSTKRKKKSPENRKEEPQTVQRNILEMIRKIEANENEKIVVEVTKESKVQKIARDWGRRKEELIKKKDDEKKMSLE